MWAQLLALRAAKSKPVLPAKYPNKKESTISGWLLYRNCPSDVGMVTCISQRQIKSELLAKWHNEKQLTQLRVDFYNVIAHQTWAPSLVFCVAKRQSARLAKYESKKQSPNAGWLQECNCPSNVGVIADASLRPIKIGSTCEMPSQESVNYWIMSFPIECGHDTCISRSPIESVPLAKCYNKTKSAISAWHL